MFFGSCTGNLHAGTSAHNALSALGGRLTDIAVVTEQDLYLAQGRLAELEAPLFAFYRFGCCDRVSTWLSFGAHCNVRLGARNFAVRAVILHESPRIPRALS